MQQDKETACRTPAPPKQKLERKERRGREGAGGTGQAQRQEQPGCPQRSPARCRWQHQDLQPLAPRCGVTPAALPPGSTGPSQLHVKEF